MAAERGGTVRTDSPQTWPGPAHPCLRVYNNLQRIAYAAPNLLAFDQTTCLQPRLSAQVVERGGEESA